MGGIFSDDWTLVQYPAPRLVGTVSSMSTPKPATSPRQFYLEATMPRVQKMERVNPKDRGSVLCMVCRQGIHKAAHLAIKGYDVMHLWCAEGALERRSAA
jgi:hypothetical protein